MTKFSCSESLLLNSEVQVQKQKFVPVTPHPWCIVDILHFGQYFWDSRWGLVHRVSCPGVFPSKGEPDSNHKVMCLFSKLRWFLLQ